MSDFKDKYKEQINTMCISEISLTASDILEAYNNKDKKSDNNVVAKGRVTMLHRANRASRTPNTSSTSSTPETSRASSTSGVARASNTLVAALVAVVSAVLLTGIVGVSAGALGYGPLADIFKNELEDEVTATIIEEGYLLEIGTTQTSEDFEFTFEGVTGETYSPMLLFAVKVADEDFCQQNKNFYVTVYAGLSEEAYNSCLMEDAGIEFEGPHYSYDTVKAVQDSEDIHTYYFSAIGGATHMINGEKFIVAIRSVRLGGTNGENFTSEIMVDTKWELSLPEQNKGVLKEHQPEFYDNMSDDKRTFVSPNGVDFKLRYIIYGEYNTEIQFEYFYPESELSDDGKDWNEVSSIFDREFELLLKDTTLVVDGVEYKYSSRYYTWCDTLGEIGEANNCYVVGLFPSIDFENASEVTLTNGNSSITLK